MLEASGFPAVATASAAVAFSLGYDDGQNIAFDEMLGVIRRIAHAVELPVSADIERGYAESPTEVARNVKRVLLAGAVGINLEDSLAEGGPLRPLDSQRDYIRAVREAALEQGVPLVINARTDVYLSPTTATAEEKLAETLSRAKAYLEAGADCIYPITLDEIESLKILVAETNAPINVYAASSTPSMRELESAGIARLSLGPGLIKASLTTMRRIALDLKNYGSYDAFTRDAMSSEELRQLISKHF